MKKDITLRSVILCVVAALLAMGGMIYVWTAKHETTNGGTNTPNINTKGKHEYLCLKRDAKSGEKVALIDLEPCKKDYNEKAFQSNNAHFLNFPITKDYQKGELLLIDDVHWELELTTKYAFDASTEKEFFVSIKNGAVYIDTVKVFDKEKAKYVLMGEQHNLIILTEKGHVYITPYYSSEWDITSDWVIDTKLNTIVSFYLKINDNNSESRDTYAVDNDGNSYLLDFNQDVTIDMNGKKCTNNIFVITQEIDVNITNVNFNGKLNTIRYATRDGEGLYINDKFFYEIGGGEASLHMLCTYDGYLIASMALWEGYPTFYIFDKDLKVVFSDSGNIEYKNNLLYVKSPEIYKDKDYYDEITYTLDLKNNSFTKKQISSKRYSVDNLD